MSVFEAVERELERVKARDPELAGGVLAATALEMARGIDDGNSLTSKSLASKELRECMAALDARAPAERAKDGIDELKSRRENKPARRARAKR